MSIFLVHDWRNSIADSDIVSTTTATENRVMTPITENEFEFPELAPSHSSKKKTAWSKTGRNFTRAVPEPGRTYKIHVHGKQQVIALKKGQLELQSVINDKRDGGSLWECIETAGWLGFRNIVSGTYMGRDSRGGLEAKKSHHKDWESFCIRQNPLGGYTILVKHVYGEGLWKVAIAKNGKSLLETEASGAQWDFEMV